MAHNLEIINGEASYFGVREPAWHKLGVTIPEYATAEEALELAKLNWVPRAIPLIAEIEGIKYPVKERQLIIRDNPLGMFEPPIILGDVGRVYRVIPIHELVALAEVLAEVSGAVWSSGGVLGQGEKVFLSLEVKTPLTLANGDVINRYFLIFLSNDGSGSAIIKPTPIRVVCQNTLNFALRGAENEYRIKHATSYKARMEEVVRALKVEESYVDSFKVRADQLLGRTMSVDDLDGFFKAVVGIGNGEALDDVHGKTLARYEDIWDTYNLPTQDNARGNAWGALNAVVEYADFKAYKSDSGLATDLMRGNALKDKALELLSA